MTHHVYNLAELKLNSSGSSVRCGWGVGGGAKKYEIYAAAFGGHLFYDLFLQGGGGHDPPGSATEKEIKFVVYGIN